MRIVHLKVSNVKNISAIEITPNPDGKAVILRGKNGAGKSAVTEAIFMALTGKKIEQPIRNDQKKATVEVDLGDYLVKWVCRHKSSEVQIWSKEGGPPLGSPRALLDKLIGDLTFDPTKLMTEKPAVQREIFMKLGGLDFAEIDKKRQELFDQRTYVNRQVRDAEGALKGLTPPDPDTPKEEISITQAMATLNTLRNQVVQWKDWQAGCEQNTAQIANLDMRFDTAEQGVRNQISQTSREITRLENQLADHESELVRIANKRKVEVANLTSDAQIIVEQEPEKITDDELLAVENNVAMAEDVNIKVRAANSFRRQLTVRNELTAHAEKLTKAIELCDVEKQGQIAAAKFPIEGLSVDTENALYHDKPLSQLSKGEQIMVGAAIGMALNPKLRILRVEDGSLLDDDNRKLLEQLTLDNDYQLWFECASEEGVGIVISDGTVKEIVE